MHHSHDEIHRLIPKVGDSMVTNLRRPIFTILEDTGPGVHDTTVSACDQYLYQQQIGVVSLALWGLRVALVSVYQMMGHQMSDVHIPTGMLTVLHCALNALPPLW